MFTLKFVRYSMYMWLPLYLLEQLGYSKLQAGMFSTVYDIGGIVGSMLQGLLLDRFCPDQPLMGVTLTMALGTLVTTLFVLLLPTCSDFQAQAMVSLLQGNTVFLI